MTWKKNCTCKTVTAVRVGLFLKLLLQSKLSLLLLRMWYLSSLLQKRDMEPVCTCNDARRQKRHADLPPVIDNKGNRPNGSVIRGFLSYSTGNSRNCFLIKETRRPRQCGGGDTAIKTKPTDEDKTSSSSSSGELWDEDMLLRHIRECRCTCNHMGYGNYLDWIEVSTATCYYGTSGNAGVLATIWGAGTTWTG